MVYALKRLLFALPINPIRSPRRPHRGPLTRRLVHRFVSTFRGATCPPFALRYRSCMPSNFPTGRQLRPLVRTEQRYYWPLLRRSNAPAKLRSSSSTFQISSLVRHNKLGRMRSHRILDGFDGKLSFSPKESRTTFFVTFPLVSFMLANFVT